MAYTGPYPVTISGTITAMVVSDTVFSGNVINRGTIGPGGIAVISSTFESGGIFDSGVISGGITVDDHSKIVASGGDASTGITVESGGRFAGGISNAGIISAGSAGVFVGAVSIFSGGITNAGTISARQYGIEIGAAGSTSSPARLVSSYIGNVVNTGTISGAVGIQMFDSTISGTIIDNGTIVATEHGIAVVSGAITSGIDVGSQGKIVASTSDGVGILVEFATVFAGGVTNGGTITAGNIGVQISGGSTFLGGVSNISGGTISASGGEDGISLASIQVFSGGVSNDGVVAARATGIAISDDRSFFGGVNNSGTIAAAQGVGIDATDNSIFSGGISNFVTISADRTGIEIQSIPLSTAASATAARSRLAATGCSSAAKPRPRRPSRFRQGRLPEALPTPASSRRAAPALYPSAATASSSAAKPPKATAPR